MKKYNWDEQKLRDTAFLANCWFNWLEILGIPKSGCNYLTLKSKAELYKIDTSHFNAKIGRKHNNKMYAMHKTDEEFFGNGVLHHRNVLKKEYIKRALRGEPFCEECGIKEWNGKPIVLQMHHIDGNSKNNSISNLRLLCPNCHSQTETFANKKRKI